ncbi:putative nuclease HARBI1 [Temnothorax longispinosus]|uniref:putative nuclease HARBI1 n=1 Tax=Temnothorax longispinosus TaxID=300112 RepID=UPI003A99A771
MEDFETRSRGISGVIGAIDGCHIPIMQLHNNAVDYYNKKGFHSVILQGVCDNKKRFIDVYIGVPGRVHDARVFRNSPLFQNIMHHNLISPNTHLIGDSAYPLSRFLLVPYKDNGHLTVEQMRYNQKLNSIRSIIERAFGLLKGKFRKLKYLEMYNLSLINYAIASACILDNFIIMKEDDYDDDYVFDDDEIQEEENDENAEINNRDSNSGHDKRNVIVQAL